MSADPVKLVRDRLAALGRQPCPRPAAGGIVVNRAGQVVLVYSSYVAQGWHFPKGGLDEGETTLEAAIKETHEEAGVEVQPVQWPAFDMGPGGIFEESLGFGSPRGHPSLIPNQTCDYFGQVVAVQGPGEHPGEVISQAALDLLRRAALAAGLSADEFHARRHELFDELRHLRVQWQQHQVYHVLAFRRRAPHRLNGESEQVRWWSLDELAAAIQGGALPIHRNVKRLLPGLTQAVAAARELAEEDR
jgi:8-oxo-dGTP pyrophosphatase MutT (NUDIX family)